MAYHANDHCMAAGSLVLANNSFLCPRHFAPRKGCKNHEHINVSWCFVCSEGTRSSSVLPKSIPIFVAKFICQSVAFISPLAPLQHCWCRRRNCPFGADLQAAASCAASPVPLPSTKSV